MLILLPANALNFLLLGSCLRLQIVINFWISCLVGKNQAIILLFLNNCTSSGRINLSLHGFKTFVFSVFRNNTRLMAAVDKYSAV